MAPGGFKVDQTSWHTLEAIPNSQPTHPQITNFSKKVGSGPSLRASPTPPRIEDLFDIIEERVRVQNASGNEDRSSYRESSDVEMSEYEAFISKSQLKKDQTRKLKTRTPPSDQKGRDRRKESKMARSLRFQMNSPHTEARSTTPLLEDGSTTDWNEVPLRLGSSSGDNTLGREELASAQELTVRLNSPAQAC